MRYANLSVGEAFSALRDYHAGCEAAAFILAWAIDNGEYKSPWFYVAFEDGFGFYVRVLRPELHHTPSDNCPCRILGTQRCDNVITQDSLINQIKLYERG